MLFTAININSGYGYVYHSKNKEPETIIEFIKDLEKKIEINVIVGDLGNEFNNYELKCFGDEHDITLDLFKSGTQKIGMINRFHRIIKEKLTEYFDANYTVK